MKVAVLGANGMLGSMLTGYLSKYYDVVATVRDPHYELKGSIKVRSMEVDNVKHSELAKVIEGCGWVINAIGSIPQKHPVEYTTCNYLFPKMLAEVSESLGCQVIQIATDCVYSGDIGGYKESSIASPKDQYGITKSNGEIISPNMHHLRCSIIGPETHGKSLLGWVLSQGKGATINGYTNHYWNGITTLQFALICKAIIDNSITLPSIQHIVPADNISKWMLIKLMCREFGRKDIYVKPVVATETIHRTLSTDRERFNLELWQMAGYKYPPTVAKMVAELAEYEGNK